MRRMVSRFPLLGFTCHNDPRGPHKRLIVAARSLTACEPDLSLDPTNPAIFVSRWTRDSVWCAMPLPSTAATYFTHTQYIWWTPSSRFLGVYVHM
jgi:hypothetical protein